MKDPNLIVQAKQGYYPMQPDQKTEPAKDLQFDLHEALVSGMTYNGVGLRLQRCQLGSQGLATCDVTVDNNSLMEETAPDGSEQASVVAVLSALDKNSILIANSVYKFALKLPGQPAATSYTNLPLRLAIPPNTQTIRVAVRDISGGLGQPISIRHTSGSLSLDTSKTKEPWKRTYPAGTNLDRPRNSAQISLNSWLVSPPGIRRNPESQTPPEARV